jgi:hypothetical protein
MTWSAYDPKDDDSEPEAISFNPNPDVVKLSENVTARQIAEAHGWVWMEAPVIGHVADKTQKIIEAVFAAGKVVGQQSAAPTLEGKVIELSEELDEYKREFQTAVDDNNRLSRAGEEKDQLLIDLQNRHAADVNRLLEARQKLAVALGFPEEYVFVPRG